jgi:hypothetical protein
VGRAAHGTESQPDRRGGILCCQKLLENLRPVPDRYEMATAWTAGHVTDGNVPSQERGVLGSDEAILLTEPPVHGRGNIAELKAPGEHPGNPIGYVSFYAVSAGLGHPYLEGLAHSWRGQDVGVEAFGEPQQRARIVCEPLAALANGVAEVFWALDNPVGQLDHLGWRTASVQSLIIGSLPSAARSRLARTDT